MPARRTLDLRVVSRGRLHGENTLPEPRTLSRPWTAVWWSPGHVRRAENPEVRPCPSAGGVCAPMR